MNTIKIKTQSEVCMEDFFRAVFEYSLNFHLEVSEEDVATYLKAINNYNSFDWKNVLRMLEKIDELLPRLDYGEDNPNTGKKRYSVSIGREGSPVIYIRMYVFREKDVIEKIKENKEKIEKIGIEIGLADESELKIEQINSEDSAFIEYRAWWD